MGDQNLKFSIFDPQKSGKFGFCDFLTLEKYPKNGPKTSKPPFLYEKKALNLDATQFA